MTLYKSMSIAYVGWVSSEKEPYLLLISSEGIKEGQWNVEKNIRYLQEEKS